MNQEKVYFNRSGTPWNDGICNCAGLVIISIYVYSDLISASSVYLLVGRITNYEIHLLKN